MSLIYLAEDRLRDRPVVLKFLRDDLLDHPRLVERFRREADAASVLKHPNIIDVYGAESFGRWPALVMEYIKGTDLARLIEQTGPVPVRIGCEIIRQAALGLQYSFERGMVHRDIKPSNLMLSVGRTVKILDFGLAKMRSELSIDADLTSTGAFLGSVDYMAPEQADDPRLADIRADLYSLGCTFYHLLSGAPPFQGMAFQVLEAHQKLEPAPLRERRPDVPAALAGLVGTMMAKEPARRFQTPGELARALSPFLKVRGEAAALPRPKVRRADQRAPSPGAADRIGFKTVAVATASGPRPRRRWGVALACAACAVGLVAAALAGAGSYRRAALKAELVIETDLPNAEVFVTQAGKRVAAINTRQADRIELEPGRYDLDLPPGTSRLRISRETLTLRRGDRIIVSVRRFAFQPDESTAIYLKLLERMRWWIPVDATYDRRPDHFRRSGSDQEAALARAYGRRPDSFRRSKYNRDTANLHRFMTFGPLGAGDFQSAESRYTVGVQLARHGWIELALAAFENGDRGPARVSRCALQSRSRPAESGPTA
jgi:hypothetical protein